VKAGWRCLKPRSGALEQLVTNLRSAHLSSASSLATTSQNRRTVRLASV
jgi:hypothetical protein